MNVLRSHPRLSILLGIAFAFMILIGSYGVWLASETNQLPWQEEPTRIVVEPFSGIPGFGGTPTPTP